MISEKCLKLFFVLVIFATCQTVFSQNKTIDLALLEGKNISTTHKKQHEHKHIGNDKKIMKSKRKNVFMTYNPVSLLLKGAMFSYQNGISPQLGRHCLYELSCSNFSKHSIYEFGVFKGVFLSADRILRCNRISHLDLHPLTFNPKTGKYIDVPSQYRFKEK
ncbi:MAG: membrane protein insertion efficiency factor YidD [Chitinophagales bacterium]